MRRTVLPILIFMLAVGSSALAQEPAAAPTLKLTVDDAVKLALDHNVDLAADRLEPQIGDTRVAAAAGAFKPTISSNVQRNNQLQPPSSFLVPTTTRTDATATTFGVNQRLPWFGTSYSVNWDASHTSSNSFLNAYDPLVRSGLSLNVSQPLFRDLRIDSARLQLAQSQHTRDIAGARLDESVVHTTAGVRRAYWNLAAAIANLDARQTAVDLAEELARVNRAKVEVGQSPPLDLVSAEAEVAANREQLIIAETARKLTEDRLRLLIFDPTDRSIWNVQLEPVDTPALSLAAIDVDSAVNRALADRADLLRAHKDIEIAQTNEKFTASQRLPDVRLNASYAASGLGGTEILRTGGFPGTIVGPGASNNFGSVLDQLFRHDYPNWAVGVSVTYPIGGGAEEARHAQSRLEKAQADDRLKSAEAKVIQQVRDAAWKIDMNARRIETTRAARELADQRLDAERKRFEVGMSTSFLVIQAQRDLAQAKTNELTSVLAYNLALVDFEALQQAGPAPAGD